MIHLAYASLFVALLFGLLQALSQIETALEQADLDRCFVWTCVATFIAGIPILLWEQSCQRSRHQVSLKWL
jgi:hypothetical protein